MLLWYRRNGGLGDEVAIAEIEVPNRRTLGTLFFFFDSTIKCATHFAQNQCLPLQIPISSPQVLITMQLSNPFPELFIYALMHEGADPGQQWFTNVGISNGFICFDHGDSVQM